MNALLDFLKENESSFKNFSKRASAVSFLVMFVASPTLLIATIISSFVAVNIILISLTWAAFSLTVGITGVLFLMTYGALQLDDNNKFTKKLLVALCLLTIFGVLLCGTLAITGFIVNGSSIVLGSTGALSAFSMALSSVPVVGKALGTAVSLGSFSLPLFAIILISITSILFMVSIVACLNKFYPNWRKTIVVKLGFRKEGAVKVENNTKKYMTDLNTTIKQNVEDNISKSTRRTNFSSDHYNTRQPKPLQATINLSFSDDEYDKDNAPEQTQ